MLVRKKVKIYVKYAICCIVLVVFIVFVLRFFGKWFVMGAINNMHCKPTFNVLPEFTAESTLMKNVDCNGFEEEFLKFSTLYKDNETEDFLQPINGTGDNSAVAVNLSALSGKYKNYNGTSVINNTEYNINDLLYASYDAPSPKTDEPYVLIYHTHTSEGYSGGGTVIDVGKEMAEEFEKNGYKTIHLTEAYDNKQFSGAYSRSAVGVRTILEKYPTINLVFDVHRDAITDSSGKDYRPVTLVDDKQTAQVMFVCGTDAKGLKHPNWRENFKFALDVSRIMGNKYGSLSRPVNLRGDRFNTHFTNYSFIMEVGSEANTLDEAKNAAVLTARAVISAIE